MEERFALYVRPLVETYQALGINAYLRPINDVHVSGKKIGGTGAAQMGQAEVVVGSFMFTFDKATMAKVLRVPSEKMRDKVFQSLEQYMTTMEELVRPLPDRAVVKNLYIQKCAEALQAEIVPGTWTAAEEAMAKDIDARFTSDEWLYEKGGLRQTGVKIHEDVRVVESAFKAPGGLVRVTARVRHDRIDDVSISGDFTMLPALALGGVEQALRGQKADARTVLMRVQDAYAALHIQSPGLTPEHLAQALAAAMGSAQ
jgi:lipoate-protein ligase A